MSPTSISSLETPQTKSNWDALFIGPRLSERRFSFALSCSITLGSAFSTLFFLCDDGKAGTSSAANLAVAPLLRNWRSDEYDNDRRRLGGESQRSDIRRLGGESERSDMGVQKARGRSGEASGIYSPEELWNHLQDSWYFASGPTDCQKRAV